MIKKIIKTLLPTYLLNYFTKNDINNTSEIDIDINYGIKELEELPTDLNINEFTKWIKYNAGSSNTKYFKTKMTGGLKLQQIPKEYANVLFEIIKIQPKSYLEIGIGNGGSWLTYSFLLRKTLKISHAVDNLAYAKYIKQKSDDFNYIRDYLRNHIDNVEFFNSDSKLFLDSNDNMYDVIFIDGDHSYEGVKNDFLKSIRHVNKGGIVIFHDIISVGSPGVAKFWNEYKNQYNYKEFIYSKTCGMGIFHLI
jgi:predicted O-methyltransferase YrrM